MPNINEMHRQIREDRCPTCKGPLAIFDYGPGPFVKCVRDCTARDWKADAEVLPKPWVPAPGPQMSRAEMVAKMKSMREEGCTLIQIGDRFDITRERARQILEINKSRIRTTTIFAENT